LQFLIGIQKQYNFAANCFADAVGMAPDAEKKIFDPRGMLRVP
jgi:hypothetical protein